MAGSDEGGAHEAVEPTGQHSQSRLLAVVGFDGSEPAYRALDAATRLISGRPGTIEVVYVAHQPFGTEMSADAGLEMMKGFDAAEHEFAEAVRSRMEGVEERWHFQRRDGAIAHELALVAEQLDARLRRRCDGRRRRRQRRALVPSRARFCARRPCPPCEFPPSSWCLRGR